MSNFVTALKSFGQHFLTDKNVLENITDVIKRNYNQETLIEIGPGTGALTDYLLKNFPTVTCIEVDHRCVELLKNKYALNNKFSIVEADFLRFDLKSFLQTPTAVVGNFPYNISSQIVFKVLEYCDSIPFMVGMFQKEMAERIASPHGSKEYGVISVLTQLLYEVKLEFDIAPNSFSPPPKVMSSVISMRRRENINFDFDYKLGDSFVFGKETKGLPPEIINAHPHQAVTIPQPGKVRSLNLATAVAISVYEGFRQISGPKINLD